MVFEISTIQFFANKIQKCFRLQHTVAIQLTFFRGGRAGHKFKECMISTSFETPWHDWYKSESDTTHDIIIAQLHKKTTSHDHGVLVWALIREGGGMCEYTILHKWSLVGFRKAFWVATMKEKGMWGHKYHSTGDSAVMALASAGGVMPLVA